jgi:hypothetical protein
MRLTGSSKKQIVRFLHCGKCLEELRPGMSPKRRQRLEVGLTSQGIQVWCARHDVEIVHIVDVGHVPIAECACCRGKEEVS